LPRDEFGGCPVYWPFGVRHGGDVSLICSYRTEREKARSDTAVLGVAIGSVSSGLKP
jgi:hypothetical protein